MSKVESQAQAALASIVAMPTTPEQLREFIAGTMQEVLSIPENRAVQAQSLLGYLMELVQQQQARDARTLLRPVVVGTYYRGSLRVEIGHNVEQGEFFCSFFEEAKDADGKVKLEEADINGVKMMRPSWQAAVLNDGAVAMLSKMVLGQPVQPGQVFFITTAAGIEAHMEAMTDFVAAQRESVEELASKTDEQLLAEAANQ